MPGMVQLLNEKNSENVVVGPESQVWTSIEIALVLYRTRVQPPAMHGHALGTLTNLALP